MEEKYEYTELLNDEDVQYICKAISGKNFKKIFADSPKEFTRIKPGFRPNSMSDEDAVEIAIKNFNKEFVRAFIEVMIKQWLKEIELILNRCRWKATIMRIRLLLPC